MDVNDVIKSIVAILCGVGLLIVAPLWRGWLEARKDARSADCANDNMFAVFDQDKVAQKK